MIWLIGAGTALLSCLTGYLLSLSGDYDTSTLSLHMWMAIALAAVSLVIYSRIVVGKRDVIYKTASVLLLILIFVTGHLGGTLTHGQGYLSWSNEKTDSSKTSKKVIANIQEAKAYDDLIQPILQSKCYGCHGRNKQKGGFRMDDSSHLMKGGKDGITLIAGNANKSELIKRLMLPREEEHHMPPKEKSQLSESEIAILHWWIDAGADFSKKVKELPQPGEIKSALLALQKPQQTIPSYIPQEKVEEADPKAIDALKLKGIVILPVAQSSSYLMANFVTAVNFKNEDIKLLLPLKKQLVWLRLSDTNSDDSAAAIIAQLSNLRILQLSNTAITDKGLSALYSLKNLQSINLSGTAVTANGIAYLRTIKTLREIFLYQTKAAAQFALLKTSFPKTVIDTGGYNLPFLETDTSIVRSKR